LTTRTNAELIQSFGVNILNELTTVSRTTTSMTVAGTVGSPGTNVTTVTVADNGNSAVAAARYQDKSFARTNVGVLNGANTFTAVASDAYGRSDTNTVTVNLPSSVSFSYDANGNLLSDGLRTFTYNQENQLTSVIVTNGVGNSTKTDFVYDGLMRMRIRREWNWQSSAWTELGETHYLYDGRRVVQERDGNNIPLVTYTWGPDLSGSLEGAGGIGGLLARTDHGNGTTAYYHADATGNITMLINAQQTPVAIYVYDCFGNTMAKAGPLADANVYRFSGKEYHSNSGMYSYGFRWYDPNLQRWLNRDPIGEKSDFNLYRFVGNNPVNNTDPVGLAYGNPVSGPNGPVGPSTPYAPGAPYYPNGFLYTRAPTPVADCVDRCMAANGAGWALGALGLASGTVGSIPKPLVGMPIVPKGNTPWTTGFSVIQTLGGPRLRMLGRQLNPYGRFVQCAAGGYLAGLTASCTALCASDPDSF
jgi:RHS repeat-associated protein